MFQLTSVPVLSHVVATFFSSIVILIPNGNFWIMPLLYSMWSVIQIQDGLIGHPAAIFMAFLSFSKLMPGWFLIRQQPLISNLSLTGHPTTLHCVA
jgi:hypothetical protein